MPRTLVIVNFARYHPANRELTSSARGDAKLKWVRMDTDWHHDPVVRALPPKQRLLWPVLMAEAGKGSPHGTIDMSTGELAEAAGMPEDDVRVALVHFRKRGLVAFATGGVA